MTITIIPTVLAQDTKTFEKLWKKVVPLSHEIQVDIMDGRFVETKSVSVDDMPDVRASGKIFEAHLMVKEPVPLIPHLIDRGFSRIIVHYEALFKEDIEMVAAFIKKLGGVPVLALNPDTPVAHVLPYLSFFDTVLFLGVHPGKNGAPYVPETPHRIRELRENNATITVQVDGGMTATTIRAVVEAGATRINSGSFVGGADDPAAALKQMYDATR